MTLEQIRESLAKASKHLAAHPADARSRDKPATAVLESGMRCRAEWRKGVAVVSDMPAAVGGEGSAPSPGWLLRAALANCDATLIAMHAARLRIVLSRLEVTVGSESDDRGLLGVDDSVAAGPLSVDVTVRIAAQGASPAQLLELVAWAEQHSPVNDALRRAVPMTTQIVLD